MSKLESTCLPVDSITPPVAEIVDDKLNITINGKSLNGISLEDQEEEPELLKNRIDYDKYDDLVKLFVHGIVDFSTFISRDVPDVFKKPDPKEQEMHSSRNGIKAFKTCIDLLERELKTGASGYEEPEDYQYLHQWYVNGLINFMGITMSDIPDKLNDLDDDKHIIKSAIEAFKQVRKLLLAELKVLSNVK